MDSTLLDMIREGQRELRQDLKELDSKVDLILEWKWKLVGGTIVVSGVLTLLFQMGLAIAQGK